ncbi:DoxX family protein [Aliikangiella marina]|uniref:DoxX family protein n=1 Tax=Aliikangiella marina TaxID=1712262 RepID=A0A545THS9_9GAMM|nr:DoxX family protein [Aliikangiella marina]TQV76746.1 DoxX family protein [Aliikangiella marina]
MAEKIVTYVLALIFILSGGAKVAGLEFEIVAFERWGYPLWFMYLTGVAEVIGGIALATNILRQFAAPALAALMVGAISTHIMHQEFGMLVVASIIFAMSVYLTKVLWSKESKSNEAATEVEATEG